MKVTFRETPQSVLAVVRHIKDLVDEARFTFTPGLLRVAVVDPAHVAMKVVEMPLATGAMEEIVFLVDLDDLKVLEQLRQDGAATFTFQQANAQSERDVLTVQQGRSTVTIKLQAAENSRDPSLPRLPFSASFCTKASEWAQAIAICGEVSDHIALDISESRSVRMSADGDAKTANIVLAANQVNVPKGGARALFSQDYLQNAAKALLEADGRRDTDIDLTARFSTDAPIEVTAQAGFCKVMFIMAPRIESS